MKRYGPETMKFKDSLSFELLSMLISLCCLENQGLVVLTGNSSCKYNLEKTCEQQLLDMGVARFCKLLANDALGNVSAVA